MPFLLYTLRNPETNEELTEKDYFEPTDDPTITIIQRVLIPLNQSRKRTSSPELILAGVEVISEAIHLHSWKRTHGDKFANRAYYKCLRCAIQGFRRLEITGEESGPVWRLPPHHKEKEELCRDPLRTLPKKLTFKFK